MLRPCCLALILLTVGGSFVQSSIPIARRVNYNLNPRYQFYAGARAYARAQSRYPQARTFYSQLQSPYVQHLRSALARSQFRPAYAQPQAPMRLGYYPQSFYSMPAACPASCPRRCFPQCTPRCCSPKPLPPSTPPSPPPTPAPPPSCPAGCPKWCIPKCNVECCNPKPPPMPEYLQRQQLTETACEGKKLRITCPNRSDKIILYSTFYGRDGNNTCQHDVLPTSGYCNEQQHRVNEKVYNLCGHERRCIVAVNNNFLAADNTTICPGVYKYLKVIYKCSQHPKIFPICPLPCKAPKTCFPHCRRDCCSPQPPQPPKRKAVSPPKVSSVLFPPPARPVAASCPAACPSYCKSPCTPQCCYGPPEHPQLQQQQTQRTQPYGVLSSYFFSQPRNARPSYLSMYRSRNRDRQYLQQNRYSPRQYFANPQGSLSSYKRYSMNLSICPAACRRRTCTPGCPRQCCTVTQSKPYYYGNGRFMNRLNNIDTLWD